MHGWDPLVWVLLPVEFVDLCRLEENHVTATAALLALGAPPPVLAEAAAAAVLAPVALPPVLADTAAAAVLAQGALPPVLAEAAAAAVLAPAALPPVLALLVYHSRAWLYKRRALAILQISSQHSAAREELEDR